jgi:hypothetical protein
VVSVVFGSICFEESSEAMWPIRSIISSEYEYEDDCDEITSFKEDSFQVTHNYRTGKKVKLPLSRAIDPTDDSPANRADVQKWVRVLIDKKFVYRKVISPVKRSGILTFVSEGWTLSYKKDPSDSDRLLCENWTRILFEDEVDVFTLLEGSNSVTGLYEKYRSDLSINQVIRYLLSLRPDSNELRALSWLVENLLPILIQDSAANGEALALHASMVCLRMLSDPSENVESTFLELVNANYVTTLSNGRRIARSILWADAALKGNESAPQNLGFTNIIVDPRQFSEDIRFLEIADVIDAHPHRGWISVSAAIDLTDAVARDPIAARVWEINQHDPKIFNMLLREPSLVSLTALARTMLATDCTDPIDLMLVFQDAEYDLHMEFEDTVNFWINISDSSANKTALTILKLVNELLNGKLSFQEICEMTTDLANGRKSFTDIQKELPIILPQPTIDDFSTRFAHLSGLME